jgi:CRP/FNR family transcriptional regulator, cyclic AMP receptor protein
LEDETWAILTDKVSSAARWPRHLALQRLQPNSRRCVANRRDTFNSARPELKRATKFNPQTFLASVGAGKSVLSSEKDRTIFSQGQAADAVFYIKDGKVKLTVISHQGKEAVVAVLGRGDFFGEACLGGQSTRLATATALVTSTIVRIDKSAMIRVLHDEPAFSELFLAYVLSRNMRVEEDLVDQMFNSSEKRLARMLLLLANFGKEDKPEPAIAKISQETLAEMIGTTRSRVSFFMNKFRKLGFIDYNGGLKVHSSLLSIVLHD